MNTLEYAKYVLENIARAKAGNVLKISDKVLNEHSAKEFIDAMYTANSLKVSK